MTNTNHFDLLRRGVETWNAWRAAEPSVKPDLGDVDFDGAQLAKVNLRGANLIGARFIETNLTDADLRNVLLGGADLAGADLRGADLGGADLRGANLRGARLAEASLHSTTLVNANLQAADLVEAELVGADLSGASLGGADFCGADFTEANLHGADLGQTNLDKANLAKVDLREAHLVDASLSRANLYAANLRGANLSGASLSRADLRLANLIDARLDNADLTGARLWETQRAGWSIKGVTCQRVFWDRRGEAPTFYEEGEFERIFAERPRIMLHYPGGMSSIDLLALPLIVERLQAEHPGSTLRVQSIRDDAGGALVTIMVEDRLGRSSEVFGQDLVRIQAKLECIVDERDRLQQRLDSIVSAGVSKIAEFLALPRQENHIYHPNAPTAIEGPNMSRDIYNVTGQAGAVGPDAHAHDNTFQQIQGGIDLPKLAEELGFLRTALKGEATGTREQDKAIGVVADAEEAAAKGDGQTALRYLQNAGKWTLGVAEKIGVAVAVEALKKAM